MYVFVEGMPPVVEEEQDNSRKTLEFCAKQGENQQQTQPTYDTEQELNPSHIGDRRARSHRAFLALGFVLLLDLPQIFPVLAALLRSQGKLIFSGKQEAFHHWVMILRSLKAIKITTRNTRY